MVPVSRRGFPCRLRPGPGGSGPWLGCPGPHRSRDPRWEGRAGASPPFLDPGSTCSLQLWTQPVHESTPREKCGPDIFIPMEPAADCHPGEETGHMGPTQAVCLPPLKAITVLVSLCLFMAQTRNPTYHGPSYLREQLGVRRAPQPTLLNLAPLPPCLGAHVSASLAALAGTHHGSPVLGEQKCRPVGVCVLSFQHSRPTLSQVGGVSPQLSAGA